MTCGTSLKWKRLSATRRASTTELTGTWDYKWPLGKTVRVAFQRPSPGRGPSTEIEFECAKRWVRTLAKRWMKAVDAFRTNHAGAFENDPNLTQGVSLEFPEGWDFHSPMTDAADDTIGVARDSVAEARGVVLLDEEVFAHRSPFSNLEVEQRRYDVLVSFEDLPVRRVDPFRIDEKNRPVREVLHVPLSELGSYAHRLDYGEPTVYLGRFGKLLGYSIDEFFKTRLAQNVVVHEFGHALGLAHAHQNPHFEQAGAFLDLEELRTRFSDTFGIDPSFVDDDFIEDQMTAWPGSPDFSDWGMPRVGLEDLQSIMTHPNYASLTRAGRSRTADTFELFCDAARPCANGATRVEPSNSDVLDLIRMYWPRAYRRIEGCTAGSV